MNKLAKLVFAASAVVAMTASAQTITDIQAKTPYSAYVQDARGVIARDPYGLCWHTGYWTPADSVPGCDGEIVKVAEAVVVPPPAPAPVAESQKIKLAADTLFNFDKSTLKPEGVAKLDELYSKLQQINLEVIIAVGYTDLYGKSAYNQKLSVRRAEAVKAYLVSKGIESNRIYTEGKGMSNPLVPKTIKSATKAGQAQQAPNRRVEVEVVGTTKAGGPTLTN